MVTVGTVRVLNFEQALHRALLHRVWRSSASLGPTEYSHADMLGVPCKPVNFGKEKSLDSPNRCAQIDGDRASTPYPTSPHIYECILLKQIYIQVTDNVQRAVGVVPGDFQLHAAKPHQDVHIYTSVHYRTTHIYTPNHVNIRV